MSRESFDYSLLAPGPVNLHPEVRKILSLPMIHHRTPEFDEIFKRVLENLKMVFKTKEPCFIHSSTGTGGMESALVNTLEFGDEVLAIISGKFGERWAEMAEIFGARVHRLEIPWGQPLNVNDIHVFLKTHPQIKAVITQACETSTATAHPIQELGALIDTFPQVLLIVDGITALGAYELPMDDWKIDVIVAGSQKAFMLPTGLSFISFSQKAWQRVKTNKTPKYYFDVKREFKANQNGESFFSASVAHIRALDYVLDSIQKIGFEKHLKIIRSRAESTRHFFTELGVALYSKCPSDSLTALIVPPSIDGLKARGHLEKKYNITVMGGQDQLKGKILRIGHMGYVQPEEMRRLYVAVIKTFKELDTNPQASWPDEANLQILARKHSQTIEPVL